MIDIPGLIGGILLIALIVTIVCLPEIREYIGMQDKNKPGGKG